MGEHVNTTTIMLVGVGGQGTILAGDLLAKTAAMSGFDVKISEIHGMSQRGGSVSTVVRFGEDVASMVCDEGCADVVVSFEAIEALRSRQYLNCNGGRLFVNDEVIVPASVAIGNGSVPDDIDARLDELSCVRIPAGKIARDAGSPKSANVVLMGALSTVLPFSEKAWCDVIASRVPPKTVDANLIAFKAGREAARG